MVRPERFELPTLWFEAKCSIQLSYGRTLRSHFLRVISLQPRHSLSPPKRPYATEARTGAVPSKSSGSGIIATLSTMSSPARRSSW
jgi:hypothetical protein